MATKVIKDSTNGRTGSASEGQGAPALAPANAQRRLSVWQRLKGSSLKRLFIAGVGLGVGLGIGIVATVASVGWVTSRPIPVREWPTLDVSGAGLKAKLKTDWNDSVRYQLVVTPRSDDLKTAFDGAIRTHRDSIFFTVHLYDKSGFELCKKDVKPTPSVNAEGILEGLYANDTFTTFECPRASYKGVDRWNLSYVFPSLSANSLLSEPSAAFGQDAKPKRSATQDSPSEGDDMLTGFDVMSGHFETRSGKTFLIYRNGERYTVVGWSASAPIHFNCKSAGDCLIENTGNNEAVHGRVLR